MTGIPLLLFASAAILALLSAAIPQTVGAAFLFGAASAGMWAIRRRNAKRE